MSTRSQAHHNYFAAGIGKRPDAEVAKALKVSRQAVGWMRTRLGLAAPSGRRDLREKRLALIRQRAAAGHGTRQIADELCCTTAIVWRLARGARIEVPFIRSGLVREFNISARGSFYKYETEQILRAIKASPSLLAASTALGVTNSNLSSILCLRGLREHEVVLACRARQSLPLRRVYTQKCSKAQVMAALALAVSFGDAVARLGITRSTLRRYLVIYELQDVVTRRAATLRQARGTP